MSSVYTVNFNDVHQNADTVVSFKLDGVNLAGQTMEMEIRDRSFVVQHTFVRNSTSGFIVTNEATGEFTFRIPKALAATLKEGMYRHDLLLTDGLGNIQRIWEGFLWVKKGITVL